MGEKGHKGAPERVCFKSAALETSCDGVYGERENEVLPD